MLETTSEIVMVGTVGEDDIDAENCAKMVKVSDPFAVLVLAGGKLCVNETDGLGHVPHTGVLSLLKGDCALKLSGKEEIFGTHQPDRSWLKALAVLNIFVMLEALEVFHLPIS